ncbi:MAG: prepilin-type N-terminal cleavage/methylation domain-containing protein [Shewanella sp.]|nr:prepilin-type N-terminal cleavage/methylation domain-containing protein [Shewanella sp.]
MNSNEKGFSLIEVMVSLVILVVGLVGVFNLHIISKQGSFESFQQTQASFLAHDIINRMKVNRTQLDAFVGGTHPDYIAWLNILQGRNENDRSLNVDNFIGGLDDGVACIKRGALSLTEADSEGVGGGELEFTEGNGDSVVVAISWRSIRKVSDGEEAHYTETGEGENKKTLIDCGDAGDRRRLYIVPTTFRGI